MFIKHKKMKKDEKLIKKVTCNEMRELTEERVMEAMKEQCVAFVKWIKDNSFVESGNLCFSDSLKWDLYELYEIFNKEN